MQDEQIVELYWKREELAIQETERKYGRYLMKIAYHILADAEDSKESVNDTYLAAWNSMPPHRPGILSAYLSRITRRIAIDLFRRKNRIKRRASEYAVSLTELEECISGGTTPEEETEAKLLAEAIGRFLRELPEESRHLFISRYYFLDSVKEAARCCGMSEAKAKTVLYRTRNSLRDWLEKEGFVI